MKREKAGFSKEKKNKLPAGISRRESIKYSGAASPLEIEVVSVDNQSLEYRNRVVEILNKG